MYYHLRDMQICSEKVSKSLIGKNIIKDGWFFCTQLISVYTTDLFRLNKTTNPITIKAITLAPMIMAMEYLDID